MKTKAYNFLTNFGDFPQKKAVEMNILQMSENSWGKLSRKVPKIIILYRYISVFVKNKVNPFWIENCCLSR